MRFMTFSILGIVPKLRILRQLLVLRNFHALLFHPEVAFQFLHRLLRR